MASKTVKRALLGFAAGALQGVQSYFQTKQAQEAEQLKEERLAAIRAEERQFTLDRDEKIATAQSARDARLAEAQSERDAKLAADQAARDAEARKVQREQLATQERIANLPARTAPREHLVQVPGADGKPVLRSFMEGDPALRAGVPGGVIASAVPSYMNAQSNLAEAGAVQGGSVTQRHPSDGAGCMLPDGKLGRMKDGICIPR